MPQDAEALFKAIKHGGNKERHLAADALKRRTLPAEWWPNLRELMRSKQYGLAIPRAAIVAVGKMKNPPADVIDELLAAASPGYQGEVPQYFSEAAASAVKIAPNDPRLPGVLAHALTIDNYQLQKSAVEALMKIDSVEAHEILRTIRSRLPREYSEVLVVKLLTRVDEFLAQSG